MKRFIASAGAILLATAMLASCSAYKNPEKYVSMPDLSTITISRSDLKKQMQERIDKILESKRAEDFKEVNEAAKIGDKVNIDYVGKAADASVTLSEATLSKMKAEKADLILGSNSFIGEYKDADGNVVTEGFEDQIVGMKAGETKDITVTFPDDYSNNAELKGVKVIFTITLHTVSRVTVDENSIVSVKYAFTDPDAPADDDTTTGDTTTEGDSEISKEEDTVKFTDLFKDGSFKIDYSAEADADATFNKFFKVADHRDSFKGANKYAKIEATLTVPEDAGDDYADYIGKTVKVTFTVDSATVLPEWNDELVKEYTSEAYTTVAAYEEFMMDSLIKSEAYNAVIAAASITEYPDSEVDKLYKQYVDQYVDQQVQSLMGVTLDNLSAAELKELDGKIDYETIYKNSATQALADVKERLIYEYLFQLLDITLSKKEYKEQLEKDYQDFLTNYAELYLSYYGLSFSSVEDYEEYLGKESLELNFKMNKVYELLPEKITITD